MFLDMNMLLRLDQRIIYPITSVTSEDILYRKFPLCHKETHGEHQTDLLDPVWLKRIFKCIRLC